MNKTEKIKKIILDAHDKFIIAFTKKDGTERTMICSKIELEKDYAAKLVSEEKKLASGHIVEEKTKRTMPEGNLLVMEEKDEKYQKRSVVLDNVTYLGIVSKDVDIKEYFWK